MSNSWEGNFVAWTFETLILKELEEGSSNVETASRASAVMAIGSTEYKE